jgi:hypothetical protein
MARSGRTCQVCRREFATEKGYQAHKCGLIECPRCDNAVTLYCHAHSVVCTRCHVPMVSTQGRLRASGATEAGADPSGAHETMEGHLDG